MMKLVTGEMLMSHLAYVSPRVHINAEKLLSSPAAQKKSYPNHQHLKYCSIFIGEALWVMLQQEVVSMVLWQRLAWTLTVTIKA